MKTDGVETCIVVAGGRGARMGGDKTGLKFGGGSLLEHAARLARGWFAEVIVVGRVSVGDIAGVRVARDIYEGRGPLGGIHAGLLAASGARCFVMGCDMPFVKKELVALLAEAAEGADVAIPRSADGKLHPLTAVYGKGCLPAIERQLESGRNKIIDFFGEVAVRYVDEEEWRKADPEGISFFNINTPEDYREALRIIGKRSDLLK